jgi:hypothetical protein
MYRCFRVATKCGQFKGTTNHCNRGCLQDTTVRHRAVDAGGLQSYCMSGTALASTSVASKAPGTGGQLSFTQSCSTWVWVQRSAMAQ